LADKIDPLNITLIDPAQRHFYQPLWTLVGAGVTKLENTVKDMDRIVPKGIQWRRRKAVRILPEQKEVLLEDGEIIEYDYLVIAAGLIMDFEGIQGVDGEIGKNGICTTYLPDHAATTYETIRRFKGGRLLFTMPPMPIKCPAAPQKIMYLAEEILNRNGVRNASEIIFATAAYEMFSVPEFSRALERIVKKKGIAVKFGHRLMRVDAATGSAFFEVKERPESETTETVSMHYDLLHVVPPSVPPAMIRESGLAHPDGPHKGWLAVDRHTLQHLKYPNVFGLGDCAGIPTSKTGAAIRRQAPVLVHNLHCEASGSAYFRYYNGYTSCPIITGFRKVMLAEFGYGGKLMPSFPVDPTVERRTMWLLKKHFLPFMYWKGLLQGIA
jgi:sulfide:quinone oxidoreductase